MISKTIKYTDYNGQEREEKFFFHLNKAEIVELQTGVDGGYSQMLENILEAKDTPTMMGIFKKIILKSYGEKSVDGKRFMKTDDNGNPLYLKFSQTEAYSELYMELATNPNAALEFIQGIMPSGVELSKENIKDLPEEYKEVLAEAIEPDKPAPKKDKK